MDPVSILHVRQLSNARNEFNQDDSMNSQMLRSTHIPGCLSGLLFGLYLAGCGPSDEEAVPQCTPGTQQSCSCVDGNIGAQTCEFDGEFAPCVCATNPVEPDADADADSAVAALCVNTCETAANSVCEDGGVGSVVELTGPTCELGTDCDDCGIRYVSPDSDDVVEDDDVDDDDGSTTEPLPPEDEYDIACVIDQGLYAIQHTFDSTGRLIALASTSPDDAGGCIEKLTLITYTEDGQVASYGPYAFRYDELGRLVNHVCDEGSFNSYSHSSLSESPIDLFGILEASPLSQPASQGLFFDRETCRRWVYTYRGVSSVPDRIEVYEQDEAVIEYLFETDDSGQLAVIYRYSVDADADSPVARRSVYYDESGRVIRLDEHPGVDAGQRTSSFFTYADDGRVWFVTWTKDSANGTRQQSTTTEYDENGRAVRRSSDWDGDRRDDYQVTYEYDARGVPTAMLSDRGADGSVDANLVEGVYCAAREPRDYTIPFECGDSGGYVPPTLPGNNDPYGCRICTAAGMGNCVDSGVCGDSMLCQSGVCCPSTHRFEWDGQCYETAFEGCEAARGICPARCGPCN